MHQEHNEIKATSSPFLSKMIAKLEMTLKNYITKQVPCTKIEKMGATINNNDSTTTEPPPWNRQQP